MPLGLDAPIIPYPTGRFFRGTLFQALRAWQSRIQATSCLATIVLSLREKSQSPIENASHYLSAYEGKAWAMLPCPFRGNGHTTKIDTSRDHATLVEVERPSINWEKPWKSKLMPKNSPRTQAEPEGQ